MKYLCRFWILSVIVLVACTEKESSNASERIIYKYDRVPVEYVGRKEGVSSQEYMSWFKKYSSYLAQEIKLDSMVFAALIQPVDFLVLKSMDSADYKAFIAERKQYEGMEYYLFSFGDIDGNDVLKSKIFNNIDRKDLMQHFDFTIQNDFSLKDCYGERQCVFYHLEPTSGIKPYYTAVIAFERRSDKDTCDKTIIYKDRAFGKGIIKITIPSEKLKLIPILKTSNNEII